MRRIHPPSVCQNIKRKRLEQNLTMLYLAKTLGISISTYCDLENGRTELTLSRLQHIADILEINWSELVDGERTVVR